MAATLAQPSAFSFRWADLPWARQAADEQRFRRILHRVLAVTVLVCLALLLLPHPSMPRREAAPLVLPPVRLVLPTPPEAPKPPAAPVPKAVPVAPAPVPAAAEAPKPAAPVAKAQSEAPRAVRDKAPVAEARQPQPNKPPGEALESARRTASGVGLLALKGALAEISGAPVAAQLQQDIKPGPGVGSGSGPGVGAGSEAGLPTRALIATAAQGSGGIGNAAVSRDTGGGGLAGRATTLVEGMAGGGGGGGAGGGGAASPGKGQGTAHAGSSGRGGTGGTGTGSGAGGSVQRGNSGKAARSLEDIKLVFERNKGAIYAIYNRALREDPGLQGKVVLELKIAPGGEVQALRLVSSELRAPELEAKLLARIRQFDFGAKDVDTLVLTWPVDFLPS